jgi:hypothetical protein
VIAGAVNLAPVRGEPQHLVETATESCNLVGGSLSMRDHRRRIGGIDAAP